MYIETPAPTNDASCKIEFMHELINEYLKQQPGNIHYFSFLLINIKGICFHSKTATCTLSYRFYPCPRAIQA
jgi:hypothetical protein